MARGRPSKKAAILDTAEELFAELGYQSTSIDLVVRKAGISKPTIYNNFPSKQALIQELIQRKIDGKKLTLDLLISSTLDYEDKLYDVFSSVIFSPFELAIFKIYYGEAHKLDNNCLDLCTLFDALLNDASTHILKPYNFPKEVKFAISSSYKNGILINTLSHQDIATPVELKQLCRLLEKM